MRGRLIAACFNSRGNQGGRQFMKFDNHSTRRFGIFIAALIAIFATSAAAQTEIPAASLNNEIKDFTAREIALHFGDIKTLNPPPERVFSALTTGDFSWGSFMRALAAQADVGGSQKIAGKDTARAIAEMGLIESRNGAKSFSQLYSTLALRHYGKDLSKNAVWQSMNDDERKAWAALLDPTRFYDPKTRKVINLPENYLGVAARVAAMSYQIGVFKDRAFLDSVVESAAKQFTDGALYADDSPPTGRYDRYSNEYARFCWDAAEIAGRRDIQDKLRASLKEQMKVWWDLVSDKGYGYNWGRSQGLVSYLDTLEIVAFLGEHPEFRPAPLADLASLYNLAWRWIRNDYNDKTHMFTVFAFGRGNYSYISREREWQQASTSFGKIIMANDSFMRSLEREKLTVIPATPKLGNVARFVFFRKDADFQLGVWLVRQGDLKFALPVTTGTKPAIADYLAAPFGLAGFSAPVEEVYPSMVPFLELEDGKTYATSEGSSRIEPSADGQSLRVVYEKWGQIGSKSGERFANGIVSDVTWRISGNKLTRTETLVADRDMTIKSWRVAVPTTADSSTIETTGGKRTDVLKGREGTLKVTTSADWSYAAAVNATGNSVLGKGVLGAIPLHLVYSGTDLKLRKGVKKSWRMTFELMK